MSRKDYELIAAAIKFELNKWGDLTSSAEVQMTRAVAGSIAEALKRDNPRFDSIRFIRACGFEL
jgi:hypothetical protein